MFDGLEVLDEGVDVSLDGLNLFGCEAQERSENVQEGVERGLQLSQQSVELGGSLVRCSGYRTP